MWVLRLRVDKRVKCDLREEEKVREFQEEFAS